MTSLKENNAFATTLCGVHCSYMCLFLNGMRKLLQLCALLVVASSCGGIRWYPDFHVADYKNSAIVSENGLIIFTDTPEFNNFACLSMEKIMELREILIRARIPNRKKNYLIYKFDRSTKVLK